VKPVPDFVNEGKHFWTARRNRVRLPWSSSNFIAGWRHSRPSPATTSVAQALSRDAMRVVDVPDIETPPCGSTLFARRLAGERAAVQLEPRDFLGSIPGDQRPWRWCRESGLRSGELGEDWESAARSIQASRRETLLRPLCRRLTHRHPEL